MRVLACVVGLAVVGPAAAGPIGFSYSARPMFRDGRPLMSADGRLHGADGELQFVPASIGPPNSYAGPVTAAAGVIPLLSLPTNAFDLDRPAGPGSGIFSTEVRVVEWADSREQWFDFAAYGQVVFADNDPARGELRLEFVGAGIERFATANNAYNFQLVSRSAGGVTRIDAEYTVTPLDGSAPVATTPEPAALASAAVGLVAVAGRTWRGRRRAPHGGAATPA